LGGSDWRKINELLKEVDGASPLEKGDQNILQVSGLMDRIDKRTGELTIIGQNFTNELRRIGQDSTKEFPFYNDSQLKKYAPQEYADFTEEDLSAWDSVKNGYNSKINNPQEYESLETLISN